MSAHFALRLRLTLAVAATAPLIALGMTGCARRPAAPPNSPPKVGYVVIEPQSAVLTTQLPGRTTAYLTSDVRPQVNGIIKARLFLEGSNVRAGQVLYQIDPAPYQAAYDQAKALLANAQAAETTDRLKAQRYAELVKINAVSKQDYDDAVAVDKQAQATVAQNKASLESARINLDYTRVKAPISGRIGRSAVTPGSLAVSGQTTALATIQALDPIYVDVNESADEVLRLKGEMASGRLASAGAASAKVKLVLSDGSTYPIEGQLRFSEALVDTSTGSVTLRAVFPNPKALLLPGLFVRADLKEGVVPGAILAPQQAVARDEKGQATAYVVDAHNTAQLRVLTTSRAIGDKWLVTAGLNPGDRLIVDGLLMIHMPGQPVSPVPADQAQPPPGAAATGGAH
jgi:membrane fusion protein (multidrug efflux system)